MTINGNTAIAQRKRILDFIRIRPFDTLTARKKLAMPARILRGLLREQIESLLPEGALAAAKIAEQSEREGLRLLANRMGGAQ